MTSRLSALRSQLSALRRARAGVRVLSAWSAFGSSLLLSLAGVFLLDWVFELAPTERLVVLLLALGGIFWSLWRFTWPLLGHHESQLDMALLVERQQRIDSDLIAALQFENPVAATWGSNELATAVIDRAAVTSSRLDVFAGLSREQMLRRAGVFSVLLSLAVLAAALGPAYVRVFADRLLLGSQHYPTRTRIQQIFVSGQPAYVPGNDRPQDIQAAQGRPLAFAVICRGRPPERGRIELRSSDGSRSTSTLELQPLTLEHRLQRLKTALARLQALTSEEQGEIPLAFRQELLPLLELDAPDEAKLLKTTKTNRELVAIAKPLVESIEALPNAARRTAILTAELPRLNDDLTYQVTAGDAWTEFAAVRMIALPTIALNLAATPPRYAASETQKIDPSQRQVAVLEGSTIDLAVECVNRKPLTSVRLLVTASGENKRIDLLPRDDQRLIWQLPAAGSPLAQVRHELHYEIEAVDADGLSPQTPLRGAIRIRPDQLPSGIAETIHKMVLPTAEPIISYRASDDYGIASVALLVDIERAATAPAETPANSEATGQTPVAPTASPPVAHESQRFMILQPQRPIAPSNLPVAGQYAISLSPLKLTKGDRLKLTLEVTDDRGENEQGQSLGQAAQADSLVLEISDESGVLAAISAADQRSEEQLTDIIKRQLGIGEDR